MKIRNLSEYIKELTKFDSFEGKNYWPVANLVSDKDIILSNLYTKKNTELKMFKNNILNRLTSFANDSNTQIFQELAQNAKDANGSKMWIYFKKNEGVVIINNGDAFHTNSKKGKEDGSLHSFLGTGEGMKWDDDTKSGQYGQGSKLLYNLLIPKNPKDGSTKKQGERLSEILIENQSAPILFSWTRGSQLNELLRQTDITQLEIETTLDSISPIFCMLTMSYFPLLPNQKITIDKQLNDYNPFDNYSFNKFKNSIKDAINNINGEQLFMSPGSLIFIPSDNEVIDELLNDEDEIKGDLKQLINVLYKDESVSLNDIFVNGNKLLKKDSYIFNFNIITPDDSHKVNILIPRIPNKSDTDKINIFTDYFPISKEKYGFSYLISSKGFNPEANREKLMSSNKNLFNHIGRTIIDNWSIFSSTPPKYLSWISALVVSNNSQKGGMVNELHFKFLKKAKDNIPTNVSTFEKAENCLILPKGFENLELNKLGIKNIGINSELYLVKEGIKRVWGINEISLTQIFKKANNEALILFLVNSSYSELREIWKKIEEEDKLEELIGIPIIPTNKGNWTSLNQIIHDNNSFLIFPYSVFTPIINSLELAGIILNSGVSKFDPIQEVYLPNFKKFFDENWSVKIIENKLTFLFGTKNISLDDSIKLTLIANLYNQNKEFIDFIKNKFQVFSDINGNTTVLSRLINPNINFGKKILNNWYLKGSLFNNFTSSLLISNNDIWDLINEDKNRLSNVVQVNKISEDLSSRLDSLLEVYNKRDKKSKFDILPSSNYLFNRDNEWTSFDKILLFKGFENLSEHEYHSISEFFNDLGFQLLPFNKTLFKTVINNITFSSLLECNDLSNWTPEKTEVSESIISILHRENLRFFEYFTIEDGDILIISAIKNKQFYTSHNDYAQFLRNKGYYKLPTSLSEYINKDNGLINADSEEFLKSILSKYGSDRNLISVVKESTSIIKREYVNSLEQLNIYSTETYRKEQFEIEIFNLAFSDSLGNLAKILHKKIILDNHKIDDSNFSEDVSINSNKYKLVDLIPSDKIKVGISSSIINALSEVDNPLRLSTFFKLKEKDKKNIFNEILINNIFNKETQAYRLSFLLDYEKINEGYDDDIKKYFSKKIDNSLDVEKVLNIFKEKKQNDFFTFWPSHNHIFKPDIQIIPNDDKLWLDDEIIPLLVNKWVYKTEENKKYLSKVLPQHKYVEKVESARKKLKEDQEIIHDFKVLLKQNLKWAKKNNYTVKKMFADKFINLIKDYNLLDKNLLVFNDWNEENQTLKLTDNAKLYIEGNCKYLKYLSNDVVLSTNTAYCNAYVKSELEKNHRGIEEISIKKKFNEKKTESVEWDNLIYSRWQKSDNLSKNYIINVVSGKIPFLYQLYVNNFFKKDILTENTGEFGRNEEEGIIKIYLSLNEVSHEENKVLSELENYKNDLFKNKTETQDYASLLNLFLPHNRGLKKPGKDGNINIKGIEELNKRDKDTLQKELAELLKENSVDELLNKLKRKNSKEEEEDKSKSSISLLSGTIGELLMEEWLKQTREFDVENRASSREVYDILVNKKTEIEVKTRAGTLFDKNGKSESTVIYLRKTQIRHIEKEKYKGDYILSLVSLTDLGYHGNYKKWRDEYKGKITGEDLPNDLVDEIKTFAKDEMNREDKRKIFKENLHTIKLVKADV